jgi:hypothetical protein
VPWREAEEHQRATEAKTTGRVLDLPSAVVCLGSDEPIRASSGSFVHIPGGTVHAFRVDSETARFLIITTPQHERFYRAIAEPAQARSMPPETTMDMEKMGAACEAYGVEGVGPRPGAEA